MSLTRAKIFIVGLGRTGTQSLCTALSILGYNKILHYPNDPILASYQAQVMADTPVVASYMELHMMYPDAKFICTIREKSSWLKSWQKLDQFVRKAGGGRLQPTLAFWRNQVYGTDLFDDTVWSMVYDEHLNNLKKHFKNSDNFLLIDIISGEGWQKLCPFLSLPIPKQTFPNTDKTKVGLCYSLIIDKNIG
ncbi:sulfotransferase [Candidatus Gracilibacteria bacterium]|nr:sulfotransferase [Candidatus Gracilibacteria bacterium]NJS41804.1 sulfotransferase [Candidatus Gracilibacteria bacterium]